MRRDLTPSAPARSIEANGRSSDAREGAAVPPALVAPRSPAAGSFDVATALAPRPAWVLLASEAVARGFGLRKHPALAFRRWCRSHGVPIRTDEHGRLEWVDTRAVDAAIAGSPPAPANDLERAADAAVDAYVAQRGGATG